MKNLKTLLTLISLLSLSASANAVLVQDMTYLDADKFGPGLSGVLLDANNPSISGEWDIVNNDFDAANFGGVEPDRWGFNSAVETVVEAAISFVFIERNQNGGLNVGSVKMNIGSLVPNGGPPIVNALEVVLDSSFFGTVYANLLTEIEDDGRLTWSVSLVNPESTSVTLFAATLGVETEPKNVPDSGATFGLLGMALFSFALVRRRVA